MADGFDRLKRTVATPAELRAKALPTQPQLTCVEPVRFQVMYLVILMLYAHLAADTCGSLVADPAQSTCWPASNLFLCKAGKQADHVQSTVHTCVFLC